MQINRVIQVLFSLAVIFSCLTVSTLHAQITIDTADAIHQIQPFDLPINPDIYIIRPGEKLEVVFLNSRLSNIILNVNSEGRIVNRELGVYDLSGLTLTRAREKLLGPISKMYHAEEIIISVVSIYPVSILVTGMVAKPGRYFGYTSQSVQAIIDSAGGILPGGSTRNIQFENGSSITIVDLERSDELNSTRCSSLLYAGKKIFVPPRSSDIVQIIGEVLTPRGIEYKSEDDLVTLINLCGGVTSRGDIKSAYIVGKQDEKLDINDIDVIKPGSVIIIPKLPDSDFRMHPSIYGAVNRPGQYHFTADMTVANIMELAGGKTPKANLNRLTIFRMIEDDPISPKRTVRYPLIISTLSTPLSLKLLPADSVYLPALLGYVKISGSVLYPGFYPYETDKDASHFINLAGGVTISDDNFSIDLLDRVTRMTRSITSDDYVYDGDEIIVESRESNQ